MLVIEEMVYGVFLMVIVIFDEVVLNKVFIMVNIVEDLDIEFGVIEDIVGVEVWV